MPGLAVLEETLVHCSLTSAHGLHAVLMAKLNQRLNTEHVMHATDTV